MKLLVILSLNVLVCCGAGKDPEGHHSLSSDSLGDDVSDFSSLKIDDGKVIQTERDWWQQTEAAPTCSKVDKISKEIERLRASLKESFDVSAASPVMTDPPKSPHLQAAETIRQMTEGILRSGSDSDSSDTEDISSRELALKSLKRQYEKRDKSSTFSGLKSPLMIDTTLLAAGGAACVALRPHKAAEKTSSVPDKK